MFICICVSISVCICSLHFWESTYTIAFVHEFVVCFCMQLEYVCSYASLVLLLVCILCMRHWYTFLLYTLSMHFACIVACMCISVSYRLVYAYLVCVFMIWLLCLCACYVLMRCVCSLPRHVSFTRAPHARLYCLHTRSCFHQLTNCIHVTCCVWVTCCLSLC